MVLFLSAENCLNQVRGWKIESPEDGITPFLSTYFIQTNNVLFIIFLLRKIIKSFIDQKILKYQHLFYNFYFIKSHPVNSRNPIGTAYHPKSSWWRFLKKIRFSESQ